MLSLIVCCAFVLPIGQKSAHAGPFYHPYRGYYGGYGPRYYGGAYYGGGYYPYRGAAYGYVYPGAAYTYGPYSGYGYGGYTGYGYGPYTYGPYVGSVYTPFGGVGISGPFGGGIGVGVY